MAHRVRGSACASVRDTVLRRRRGELASLSSHARSRCVGDSHVDEEQELKLLSDFDLQRMLWRCLLRNRHRQRVCEGERHLATRAGDQPCAQNTLVNFELLQKIFVGFDASPLVLDVRQRFVQIPVLGFHHVCDHD